ncbi:sugar phosphate isomerase/epimerase family protein [Tunicatimonas pelagia]|uniref:sugar phosphate isomerase/epimerase family protein n=1 Tax=Tunicatimonas pelagia TaxID=931531 RepID=UPI002664E5A6|nr:sugar phosphate isomerase/epimerase family protein [Tunicatimonas pelagia]WKN44822.1 sugar phosphate isomerase/epimerase [Tunicatimonas pelagia]
MRKYRMEILATFFAIISPLFMNSAMSQNLKKTANDEGYLLWAANVRSKSFEERLEAARAGGYTQMSVFPIDIQHWEAQGKTIDELKRMCEAAGVKITVLDPFTRWLPRWQVPPEMSRSDADFVRFDEDEFFRIARELEVESMTIIETFGTKYSLHELVAHASVVADKARDAGIKVHIEFMPFSGIPDLETAWQIVQQANRDNLGIVLDTWHYYRGNVNDSLLAAIPGDKIFRVQVADATQELQGGDLFTDLMHYRMLPGKGDFPLIESLSILKKTGGLTSVGPELFSDKMDMLPAKEVGKRTARELRQLMDSL